VGTAAAKDRLNDKSIEGVVTDNPGGDGVVIFPGITARE
jgi:hypothetical protein